MHTESLPGERQGSKTLHSVAEKILYIQREHGALKVIICIYIYTERARCSQVYYMYICICIYVYIFLLLLPFAYLSHQALQALQVGAACYEKVWFNEADFSGALMVVWNAMEGSVEPWPRQSRGNQ